MPPGRPGGFPRSEVRLRAQWSGWQPYTHCPSSFPSLQLRNSQLHQDFLERLDNNEMHRSSSMYDDPLDVVRGARAAVKEANARAVRMQQQTTQQLNQRVKDLKYWSNEIDRELQDLKDENDDVIRSYRRLQMCVEIASRAARCNENSHAVRRKRVQVGDVNTDRVDQELAKEKGMVGDAIKNMKDIASALERQLEANQGARKALMRDLTLKHEAILLDNRSVALGLDLNKAGQRTPDGDSLEYRDGVPLQRMSEYQEWIENTAHNLNYAAKARVSSRKLGQRMYSSLRDTAAGLRSEAITIESLLKDSCRTWQEWRDNLHGQVVGKDKELKSADAAIEEINIALRQKGSPLHVALQRQNQRGLRPGIELCNDKAQYALQQELSVLKTTLLGLQNQLDKTKDSRNKLAADRARLQGKLEICEQNLLIDNEILRVVRSAFPHEIQLSGFLLSDGK